MLGPLAPEVICYAVTVNLTPPACTDSRLSHLLFLIRRNVNPLHPDVCESGYHRHNSKAVKRVSEYAYVHKSKTEDANSRRICIIHIPPTIMSLNHSHNTQA
ncbi:hypothetical protein CF327_g664 [Tilletia walkeri]|nr:hypothetical protein CF327_g664 [Tilletia walkeri]